MGKRWRGHKIRQNIRQILLDYAKAELAGYGLDFRHPIKLNGFLRPYRTTILSKGGTMDIVGHGKFIIRGISKYIGHQADIHITMDVVHHLRFAHF